MRCDRSGAPERAAVSAWAACGSAGAVMDRVHHEGDDGGDLRNEVVQEFHAFGGEHAAGQAHAREIAAWPIETGPRQNRCRPQTNTIGIVVVAA